MLSKQLSDVIVKQVMSPVLDAARKLLTEIEKQGLVPPPTAELVDVEEGGVVVGQVVRVNGARTMFMNQRDFDDILALNGYN